MDFLNSRRALLVAAALAVAGCSRSPAKLPFAGVDITGSDFARTLSLPDTDGKMRTLEDFKGKVTMVFFGFTQCPDVCPATMHELSQVKAALGADGKRVQGVFVTVDPERDTPDVLKAYVKNFNSDFVPLRGSLEQTRAAAKEFKVSFNKVRGGRTPDSYSIDHTAGAYLFDAQGRARVFVRYGSGSENLMHDLKLLLAERA